MIRILIVDNHPIVRTGLELFLNSKPDLKVVGKLSSGIESRSSVHPIHSYG